MSWENARTAVLEFDHRSCSWLLRSPWSRLRFRRWCVDGGPMSPFRGVGNAAEHRQDAIVLFDHRAPRDPQRLVHPWLPVSKGAFETVPHDLQRRPCLLSKFVHQLGLRLKLAEPAHVKKVLVAVL